MDIQKTEIGKVKVEWDILLLSSRVSLNESELRRLQRLVQEDVDWQQLIELAAFHRTFALVFRQLISNFSDFLPLEFIAYMKSRLRTQGVGNLRMSAELLKVLAVLRARGIQAVPFKGPVFTEAVFGDLTLRSYCDLDILIERVDLTLAVEVIRKVGYTPSFPMTDSQLEVLAKTDNEYPLQHEVNGITIDLQWELTGGYTAHRLFLSSLVPNLGYYNFLGKSVPVFGQEDLLVYLCIHGNQHVWEQLDQVCCIAESIKISQDLNWDLVWSRAKELGVGRMVRIGLLLASTLLATELPKNVMSVIEMDRQAIILAEERMQRIAEPISKQGKRDISRRFILHHWKSLDTPWQVIRYGCHILFVPTRYDWQKLPLPVWLSPLHYIYRPLRLLLAAIKVL